ncbi:hypothetical protein V8C86DRAFT_2478664 [Haematococcus lacustris]
MKRDAWVAAVIWLSPRSSHAACAAVAWRGELVELVDMESVGEELVWLGAGSERPPGFKEAAASCEARAATWAGGSVFARVRACSSPTAA